MAHVHKLDRELCLRLLKTEGSAAGVHRALAAQGINVIYGTVRRVLRGVAAPGRTQSRFPSTFDPGRERRMPAINNPALLESRTLYPASVVDALPLDILKSGKHSSKIGGVVLKGKWRGMPIYTLTLEERATCPTSCHHWVSCFGNKMNFAVRMSHKVPGFGTLLAGNVKRLGVLHPGGFVVRLHVLGDFYSAAYVSLWEGLLDAVPALRVFGYSARWDVPADPVAAALVPLVMRRWERFAIRFSDAPIDECATVSLEHPMQVPADALVCPEQAGQSESCSQCCFCWHSKRRVAFVQH